MITYGSVCSGIEAATVAWHPLGWQPAFFSEIDKFPSAVLAHHYPDVPNRGDMTKFKEWPDAKLDVLVGGTPCQSFSVAGLRKGLDDPRGNLMLTYLAIVERYCPRIVVWENVPGVCSAISHGAPDPSPPPPPLDMECDGQEMDTEDDYSTEEIHAFQCFLAGLSELGYGFAYRILDAQYIGVPQRRRRVFVVGYFGSWQRAAAVLFERHSLSGNPPPRREAGQEITGTIGARTTSGGGFGGDFEASGGLQPVASTGSISHCLNAGGMGRQDYETETLITHSLRGEGFDASEDGTGRSTPLIPVAIQAGALRENPNSGPDGIGIQNHIAYTLEARSEVQAVAFDCKASGQSGFGVGEIASTMRSMGHANSHQNGGGHQAVAIFKGGQGSKARGIGYDEHLSPTLSAADSGSNRTPTLMQAMQVRRLTPRECERLQGFPDYYTLIPDRAADGPRYKALGNSMAVPVMRWIGERIDAVERLAVRRVA